MSDIFTTILRVEVPEVVQIDPATGMNQPFVVRIVADGLIPFPQVILWAGITENLFRGTDIEDVGGGIYAVKIPAGVVGVGNWMLQAEGCRKSDLSTAGHHDWIKFYQPLAITSS